MIKLTLRQMEYFEALAETAHFGRAAELAGVSQPALSAQISEMERRLGVKLFERGGKTARLTPEAQVLRERIERILGEVREVERSAEQARRGLRGRFRLGIIPTVAPYLLPGLLGELRRRFPDLQVEIREAITPVLAEDVAARRLDALIAALPLERGGLMAEPLFSDRFLLAVPADDPGFRSPPVSPESPALERLMLLEEGHCLREQALAICARVRPVAMASFGATSLTTLLQMVAHGLGVTLVPEMAAAPASVMPNVRLVPFKDPEPSRTICLAWRRNTAMQAQCRELAETIRSFQAAARTHRS
jgi:LysR family hydrogen peroxide-inducible transcriptional activator